MDELGLTPCQLRQLRDAIRDHEANDARIAAGVSDTDWQGYSRDQRRSFYGRSGRAR